MSQRKFVAILMCSALAGCDLGAGPLQPHVAMPAEWSEPVSQVSGNTDVWPAPDWWRSFQSSELNALMAQARTDNLDIAAAAARVLQAEAQLRVAGASLLPHLDLNANVKPRGPAGNGIGSSGSGTSQRTSAELSLEASYELDFWGKNRDNAEAAKSQLNASQYDRETVALTVTSGVASTYLQILALRDRMALARQTLDSAQQVERVVEAKARYGAVSALDLAQQRSQVAAQQAAIPPLELQEKQSLNALALLLGRNPEGFQVTGTSLAGIALPTIGAGLPSGLLVRRPDVKEAEANLAAANANLYAARAAMLPNIDLSVTAGIEAIATSLTTGGIGAAYAIVASLAQPIFDAGQLRAQKDVAAGKQIELVQAYRSAILSALSDVENSLASIDSLRSQRQYLDDQRQQASAALDLAQTQYRAGTSELLPVLDAQRTQFQAQDQATQTSLAQFQAAISLYKALGGGWQDGNAPAIASK